MRALAAGFQSHLAKPFDPSDLVAAVAALAGRTRRPGAGSRRLPRPKRRRAGGARTSRVLIVEDDRDSREGLRELLEVWDTTSKSPRTGPRAVEKAIATSPRIAIIDIGLPGSTATKWPTASGRPSAIVPSS
jgi:DNA-binding response OmpR family regulator